MRRVELIYDPGCPNVGEARAQLLRAFVEAKRPPQWTEWSITDPRSPARVRHFGSPTILVDGKDVSRTRDQPSAASCRIYDGARRAPDANTIAAALARRPPPWRSSLAVMPAVGTALLPKVACPACWPAYGGVLSALGLGSLMDSAYLLPLTAIFLFAALSALAFRAKARRGFGPLGLGAVAALLVLVGKFAWNSDSVMYLGIAVLVGASLWNTWPRAAPATCASCAPKTTSVHS